MNPENRPIRSIFTVMSTAIRTLEKEGRLTMEKSYIQHGSTSVYEHSVKVAYTSLYFARRFRLNIDEKSLIRGALLHDYFLFHFPKIHVGNEQRQSVYHRRIQRQF